VQSRTYEVTFAGAAGAILRAEFDDCAVSVGPDATTLRLEIPDQGALYELLHRIASFGLELTGVSVVAPPADVRDEDSRSRQAQFRPAKGTMTAEVPLDELGPVDYMVVEFPTGASSFTGEMTAELRALADSGTIRVIDVLILTKDADGTVEATELSDIAELGELQAIEAGLAELLAADDVGHLAAAMEPGSTAGVLIWENLWAAPFASAARRSGGQLIANGRIPIQAIIASIQADQVTATVGD
jgi:sugar phosphate isomerase/epimerase